MSESYLFATNKTLDQETIVWTNQISSASTLNFSGESLTESFNETYVTAIEGNDSEYLSVLETTNETTLEDLNLTLSNSKHEDNSEVNIEQSAELNPDENGEQVVVFSVDGSDELYGIQMILDEQGNTQKYQFKFRQNEQGQLEAIPETIHLLLNEGEDPSEQQVFENEEIVISNTQQFQSDQEAQENDTESTIIDENQEDYQTYIKGEPCEQIVNHEENFEQQGDIIEEDTIDVKPVSLELQQAVKNMKSELFQEETCETHEIYQQEHIIYHEESSQQEIFHQDESQEIFNSEEADTGNYHDKDEGHIEESHEQTEETLVPEDVNSYEEHIDQVQSFETIQFHNNQMVLETQYIPDIEVTQDTDTDDEFGEYESIYVQSGDQNIEANGETLLHEEEQTVTELPVDYNHEASNEHEGFQVVEAVHITGEDTNLENSYQESPLPKSVPSTILKQPIQNTGSNVLKQQSVLNTAKVPKKSKKVLCYVIQHSEKENVNAISSMVPKNYKANPRSVLKQSAIDISLTDLTPQETQIKYTQSLEKAKLERRFAKNKDAIQAKLFNNFLSKTTIPHAPVRQKRLPRKQEIKPVDTRTEEEIIVQEVMVSSNGFIETVEDRMRGKEKLEVVGYIDLSDSEDENSKASHKKLTKTDGVIEILSSEEESEHTESTEKPPETPKKRRGRPRKNPENASAPQKEDDEYTTSEQANDSADESSPSKKTRTDNTTIETVQCSDASNPSKKEFNCPLCSKTFPSPNSLSTHIHHHSLENSMRKTRPSTFEFKHKCNDCDSTFKNSLLLNRHACPNKNKKTSTSPQCEVCQKTFDSQLSLNIHKKTHVTGSTSSIASFAKPTVVSKAKVIGRSSTVAKRLTLDPKKGVEGSKEANENKTTEQPKEKVTPRRSILPRRQALLTGLQTEKITSRKSMLPKRHTLLPEEITDNSSKYKCEKCNQTFKNGVLLRKHICKAENTNDHKCYICNLTFKDVTLLNIHKRRHIKANLVNSTSDVQISPMKFLPAGKRDFSPSKSMSHLKVPHKSSPSFKVLKKFTCSTCNAKFTSKVLLDVHTRKQCVKTPINKRNSRLSLGKSVRNPNITIMPTTPLDMHAQCDACPQKFKSYKMLLKHQITVHGYSPPDKDLVMKPKPRGLVTIRDHTGIPANPRLQKSFANLMKKLQNVTPRKPDNEADNI